MATKASAGQGRDRTTASAAIGGSETGTIRTKIPARMDRLPWARFHWIVVAGLGTAWILDGSR